MKQWISRFFVVNNTGDADTRIWNYIAAMTNVKDGNTAKAQTADIRAATYQWDSSAKKFVRLRPLPV